MIRRSLITAVVVIAALPVFAAPAGADFGLKELDVTFSAEDGTPATQAGSHPFAMTTSLQLNSVFDAKKKVDLPEEAIRDLRIGQIKGLVGNPTATPRCSTLGFLTKVDVEFDGKKVDGVYPDCPDSSAIGTALVSLESPAPIAGAAVYNLEPPPGVAAKIGFYGLNVPVTVELGVNPEAPYNVVATLNRIAQAVPFLGSEVTLWGNPAAAAHNPLRGHCVFGGFPVSEIVSNGSCPTSIAAKPFLTLPRSCRGPLQTTFEADSWVDPGDWFTDSVLTHDGAAPPNPQGFSGCANLGFKPSISAQPTTKAASSPTGLDFSLDVQDEGLTNPSGNAQSDIEKAVVTLPEGFTVNPSLAEGLNVCTQADLERESARSAPGEGCPAASKVGTVQVETPLLEETVPGALYVAKPYENPFGSLVALYLVLKNPTLGISITQPLRVEMDPRTGRLSTFAEDLPELPFSHFRLHFREGTRSPLASPAACGTYSAEATLYPSAGGAPVKSSSAFQIISGPDGGPCPSGGLPPFRPGLIAGTLNNAAGRFSPFYLRLFRSDAEQEITRFSVKLPPGIVAKLAGVPYCPEAAIAAAKARSGRHGGQEELDSPSCPAASEIGRSLAGAGVGPSLAYAPGKLYLAGPYNGAPLSMVAITAARVGPYDLGTVVIREAFEINPETGEVFIDATGSDPIPHIIRGVPVHLRDIEAVVDRPQFTLNPTDCTRTSTASTLLGSGLDFGSEADDRPITVATPFQAADCAALSFKPRLSLKLKGATRRGAHPALKATLRMGGFGEAGVARAQVTLPRSEFIENAHFNTICTRPQFKAGEVPGERCPAGSIYGYAKAVTPILAEPLQGPVFLRSSEHQLPDVVASLHNGQIDVVLVGHVDSVKGKLRNTFEATPDAPVSSVTLSLFGGKKGLFVNSTNLCKGTNRAIASFTGQNGKQRNFRPVVEPECKGKGKRGGKR